MISSSSVVKKERQGQITRHNPLGGTQSLRGISSTNKPSRPKAGRKKNGLNTGSKKSESYLKAQAKRRVYGSENLRTPLDLSQCSRKEKELAERILVEDGDGKGRLVPIFADLPIYVASNAEFTDKERQAVQLLADLVNFPHNLDMRTPSKDLITHHLWPLCVFGSYADPRNRIALTKAEHHQAHDALKILFPSINWTGKPKSNSTGSSLPSVQWSKKSFDFFIPFIHFPEKQYNQSKTF